MTSRVDNWEAELNKTIDEFRSRPYVLGESDCFALACAAISSVTGEPNRWEKEWKGRYHTKDEAIKLIMERGGFLKAFSDFFHRQVAPVHFAQRGDICIYPDAADEFHLVVCLGAKSAGYFESGARMIPTSDCIYVWRVE